MLAAASGDYFFKRFFNIEHQKCYMRQSGFMYPFCFPVYIFMILEYLQRGTPFAISRQPEMNAADMCAGYAGAFLNPCALHVAFRKHPFAAEYRFVKFCQFFPVVGYDIGVNVSGVLNHALLLMRW